MINAGIIGANGYAGSEVVRLLLNHPFIKQIKIYARSDKGKNISDIYPSFYEKCELIFEDIDQVINESDIIFAGLPHGLSEEIAYKVLNQNKKFIDLGADFRLDNEEDYKKWYEQAYHYPSLHQKQVYGLPEIHRNEIKESSLIGNPGCYPTSIELGLYPLIKGNFQIDTHIIVNSASGVTGAGKSLTNTSHFATLFQGYHPYKVANHRHIPEIIQELNKVNNETYQLTFVPHLLPINRGIVSTIYVKLKDDVSLDEIYQYYQDVYQKEEFVHVLPLGNIADLKYVIYSNNCHISLHMDKDNQTLIIVSTIDNMIKGTAGQAIQNMNLMFGLKENTGLTYIGPSF